MKKYFIGVAAVAFLFMGSLLYKSYNAPRLRDFPLKHVENGEKASTPKGIKKIFLYVFLSSRNCRECLEIVSVLNSQIHHPLFEVTGVVPDEELKEKRLVRLSTGAEFPLIPESRYKRYVPVCTPAVVGVRSGGELLFVLPGVRGGRKYLEDFLLSLLAKLQTTK